MQGLRGYSFHASFVLGFHGCGAATARDILSGRLHHLRTSENRYDWLGSGIYFWEASAARAREWARQKQRDPSRGRQAGKEGVIGAIIDLGNCLDLLDSQHFALVRDAYRDLQSFMAAPVRPMPTNRPLRGSRDILLRDLDCSVINFIHQTRTAQGLPAFDSVRVAFIEGKPLYESAGFHDRNHIQICVRNLACIKGYFRPILDGAESD